MAIRGKNIKTLYGNSYGEIRRNRGGRAIGRRAREATDDGRFGLTMVRPNGEIFVRVRSVGLAKIRRGGNSIGGGDGEAVCDENATMQS